MKNYPAVRIVFDRIKKASKQTSAPVLIEVQFKGKKKYINTGVKVFKNEWDAKNNKVTSRNDMLVLNERIRIVKDKIDWYINDLQRFDKPFVFDNFSRYINTSSASVNFKDYAYSKIDNLQVRDTTKGTYRYIIDKAIQSGSINDLVHVSKESIHALDSFLRIDLSPTRSRAIHSFIHQILRIAINEGIISEDPYIGFKMPQTRKQKIRYLTIDQLKKVEDYKPTTRGQLSIKNREITRDMFVLCAYSGLAISDALVFNPDNLDKEGIYKGRRFKTGVEFTTIVLDKGLEVLKKYNGIPPVELAMYKNTIRAIGKSIGINLSSHMARHTFATTVTLANGVPLHIVNKMIGHSRIATSEIYAKVMDESVAEAGRNLAEKLKKEGK